MPNSTALKIVATIVSKPSSADALRDLLSPAVDAFRDEPGCLGYVLLEDRNRPGRFVTYETWADEAALNQHMSAPALSALGPKLQDLLESPPAQDFLSVVVER